MTICIGMLCSDGAVVGADQAVTYEEDFGGEPVKVGETLTEKICFVNEPWSVLAGAGGGGGIQLVRDTLKAHDRIGKKAETVAPRTITAQIRAHLAAIPDFLADKLKEIKGRVRPKTLIEISMQTIGSGIYMQGVGHGASARPVVVHYEGALLTPSHLESGKLAFCVVGTGSTLALPFMRILGDTLFTDSLPTLEQGMLLVYWVLQGVIDSRAGGGVGGEPRLATLSMGKKSDYFRAAILPTARLEELHAQHVEIQRGIKGVFEKVVDFGGKTTGSPPTLES